MDRWYVTYSKNTKTQIEKFDLSFKLKLQNLEAEVKKVIKYILNTRRNHKLSTFNAQKVLDLNRQNNPSNSPS